uniref:Transmembrane protein n=1 Tax=Anopheles melas TaxID=34690 RepID=A0A182THZ5_9DIPT
MRFSGFIVCFACGFTFLVSIYSFKLPPPPSLQSLKQPPSPLYQWVELYRTLADTVATYRAGGQLAFTRLNLKLLPKFRPVLLLLLLLTVLDGFFCFFFAPLSSSKPIGRTDASR